MAFLRRLRSRLRGGENSRPLEDQRGLRDAFWPDDNEPLADFHRRMWFSLRESLRAEAVRILRRELAPESLFDIRALAHVDPGQEWVAMFHMFGGMGIRNLLRREGLTDDMLPSGNWDDYYIEALIAAAQQEGGFDVEDLRRRGEELRREQRESLAALRRC